MPQAGEWWFVHLNGSPISILAQVVEAPEVGFGVLLDVVTRPHQPERFPIAGVEFVRRWERA